MKIKYTVEEVIFLHLCDKSMIFEYIFKQFNNIFRFIKSTVFAAAKLNKTKK